MRQSNTTTLARPALPPALPLGRAARRLAVLTFQDVTDRQAFAAQVERLQRTAAPVSLDDVERALSGGAPLPPHAVLLTFERGHRSAATEALPVLAARRVPGVAFVVPGLVDTDRPYWWQEARFLVEQGGRARGLSGRTPGDVVAALSALPDPDRRRSLEELRVTARRPAPGTPQLTAADLLALRDGGVELGNHTLSHARLDTCDGYVVREEVAGGHERLTRLTGEQPRTFAYPDAVFDERVAPPPRGLAYRSAFVSDGTLFDLRGAGGGQPDPLRISRLKVTPGTSRGMFDGVLSGWTPTARRLRGAVAI